MAHVGYCLIFNHDIFFFPYSRSSSDYPFACQLANLLFELLLRNPVFLCYAPAGLASFYLEEKEALEILRDHRHSVRSISESDAPLGGGGGNGLDRASTAIFLSPCGVRLWPGHLGAWIARLPYFLSFFTQNLDSMTALLVLHDCLIIRAFRGFKSP